MKQTGFDGGNLRLPKSFYDRPLTPKEAKSKLSTISSHRRKYNAAHPKGYDAYRVDACIYIMRVGKGK